MNQMSDVEQRILENKRRALEKLAETRARQLNKMTIKQPNAAIAGSTVKKNFPIFNSNPKLFHNLHQQPPKLHHCTETSNRTIHGPNQNNNPQKSEVIQKVSSIFMRASFISSDVIQFYPEVKRFNQIFYKLGSTYGNFYVKCNFCRFVK